MTTFNYRFERKSFSSKFFELFLENLPMSQIFHHIFQKGSENIALLKMCLDELIE